MDTGEVRKFLLQAFHIHCLLQNNDVLLWGLLRTVVFLLATLLCFVFSVICAVLASLLK